MGYDIHIVRTREWSDGRSNPIRLDEWLKYLENDHDMRRDDVAKISAPNGTTITYESVGLAVWTAYSRFARGVNVWFEHREYRIVVKSPDDESLEKMKQIAEYFQAYVVGDEGEEY